MSNVFPSGAGAPLFRSWSTFINRSIILTPEADRTDKKDTTAFNTWKDIIIPGNVDDAMTKNGQPDVQPLPVSKRKYLANYLGRAQGKAGRLKLIELSKQYPDKNEIHQNGNGHQSYQFSSTKTHAAVAAVVTNIVGPTATAPATSVYELLECPVCTYSMYPPIHQCHNGHTLCSTCKVRVHNRCPTCRQELGDIRCLALEKVAESLELPLVIKVVCQLSKKKDD